MKIFDFNEISSLRILPESALEWVREAFMMKSDVCLPPKISIKQNGNVFFNTMPCLIPQLNRFGVKEVSRFPSRVPSLQSQILLYEASSGNLLSLMDATWKHVCALGLSRRRPLGNSKNPTLPFTLLSGSAIRRGRQ